MPAETELLACPFCAEKPESNSMFAWCRGPKDRRHIVVNLPICDWNTRPTPALPDGYVIVPKEPTQAMLDAGVLDHPHEQSFEGAKATWEAMIAAAPPVSSPALPDERAKLVEKGWQLHRRALSYSTGIPAANALLADCGEFAKAAAEALSTIAPLPNETEKLLELADAAVTWALDSFGGYCCEPVDQGIAYMQARGKDRWSMQAQIDAGDFGETIDPAPVALPEETEQNRSNWVKEVFTPLPEEELRLLRQFPPFASSEAAPLPDEEAVERLIPQKEEG